MREIGTIWQIGAFKGNSALWVKNGSLFGILEL